MKNPLPPLTALRAFDAAARHLSFAKAADELNVTPAALSLQIKSLEDHFGGPLFLRHNRAVTLTEAGEVLAPGTRDGFENLIHAWNSAKRSVDRHVLTITAGPALTAKWLAPRLYEFARTHPEIDLRLSASLNIVDLKRDDVDIAVRYGEGVEEGLYSVELDREWVTPVMSPELAEQFSTQESLATAPLIHDGSICFLRPRIDWATWFRTMDLPYEPGPGTHFSNADHAVAAAVAGVGVVLGRRAMIIDDLMNKRLVAPFKTALATTARFRFLCVNGKQDRPQVAAFRDWFLAEVEKTAHIFEEFDVIPVEDIPS